MFSEGVKGFLPVIVGKELRPNVRNDKEPGAKADTVPSTKTRMVRIVVIEDWFFILSWLSIVCKYYNEVENLFSILKYAD